jgi:hypothetical protein
MPAGSYGDASVINKQFYQPEGNEMVTTPTVGRKVWYWPSLYDKTGPGGMQAGQAQPLDATVVYVHSDRMVNLVVFDCNGNMHKRTSVTLRQPEDTVHEGSPYCEWMPYQVKQHEKKAVEASTESPSV